MAPKKKPNRRANVTNGEEGQHQVADSPPEAEGASKTLKNELKLNGHALQNGCCNGTSHSHQQDELKLSSPVSELAESLDRVQLVAQASSDCPPAAAEPPPLQGKVTYVQYQSELQMPDIMRLIQKDLSEPYSIYTYRYFIHNWPMLCFLAMYDDQCVGAIVCKLDIHKKIVRRGYIAMLAVDEKYRQEKIGSNLVMRAIAAMITDGADEVVLETEITNEPALRLYENLGFVRDKRLFRYYLNGVDALRLKLWLR
uniref:N-terminal methionine N(alpha)-acetyltransferase NatC n=1 Tax=Alona affinis TaxID=381656 RepID=A0A9N6WWG0_9CRUS|nr:EOG090X07BN [Alona affinis]